MCFGGIVQSCSSEKCVSVGADCLLKLLTEGPETTSEATTSQRHLKLTLVGLSCLVIVICAEWQAVFPWRLYLCSPLRAFPLKAINKKHSISTFFYTQKGDMTHSPINGFKEPEPFGG